MPFEKKNKHGGTFLPVGKDLQEARKLTRRDFERIAHKYLLMTAEDIEKIANTKQLPMIDYMVISVMLKAVENGDDKRLDFLLDRTIGQIVRRIKIETEVEHEVVDVPVQMTTQEKLAMVERMRTKLLNDSSKEKAEHIIDAEVKDVE